MSGDKSERTEETDEQKTDAKVPFSVEVVDLDNDPLVLQPKPY